MKKPGLIYKSKFLLSNLFKISFKTSFHGSSYGGWTICPEGISKDSVIYSFGIGKDASFDLSLIEKYNAQVYAFDPTPRSRAWIEERSWPQEFKYFPLGIAAQSGKMNFHPPENPAYVSYTLISRPGKGEMAITGEVRRLSDLAELNGHKVIDILKMDIEGAEYEVIPDILNQKHIRINQILVEFHDHFPDLSWKQTRQAICQMESAGYVLFHISANGYEYSFIKQD